MITFKQFLREKVAMNPGAYAKARERLKDDAKIGFEIEVFVPQHSMYWADFDTGAEPKNVESISRMDTLIEFSAMFNLDRRKIEHDYGSWLAEQEDEFVDQNWDQYDDDEKRGRKEAARHFDASKHDFTEWFHHTFRSALQFIQEYDLEPKYGWHQEGHSVFTTEPESAEYMDGWRDTALGISKSLQLVVKDRVRVSGAGYESWNITHDSSIKDDDGVDYESGMGGYGLEIVSPPLPVDKAFELIAKVLTWCDRNEITTNETTGIHVNISIGDLKQLDPLKLVLFMGDKYVLQKFARATNTYTKSQSKVVIDSIQTTGKPPKDAKDLMALAQQALQETGKSFSVNLNHLPHYLEFRAAGGAGYHKRLDDIHEVIGRWLTAVELASDPGRERQLYLKKVAQLLNAVPGEGDTLGSAVKAAKAKKALA